MKRYLYAFSLVLSVLGLATYFIWAKFTYPLTGIDDANIFFVYARNLASGYGFVFNVGGERVEGVTSLLWTLICSLVYTFAPRPELVLLVVNVIIIALGTTICLFYIYSEYRNQKEKHNITIFWSVLFLILLFTSARYLMWNTISLMENGIWGNLLLITTIIVIKDNLSTVKANLLFIPLSVLLLFTRPEAFLWVTVFIVIVVVRRTSAYSKYQALIQTAPVFTIISVTVLILTIFRLSYFGYPLPNTFYAKVSPSFLYDVSEGMKYFVRYSVSDPIVWICILATILGSFDTILIFLQRKFNGEGKIFLPIIACISLLLPVTTGGDHFTSFRFYQTTYPILLLCLFYFLGFVFPHYMGLNLHALTPQRPQIFFLGCLASACIISFISYQALDWHSIEKTSGMAIEFSLASGQRETGEFMREMFTPLSALPSVGAITVGGLKYTYPGDVVDLMGLNNTRMAHNGGDRKGTKNHAAFEKDTFYQLSPAAICVGIAFARNWRDQRTEFQPFYDRVLKGLTNDPAFLSLYTYARIDRKGTEKDKSLVGWFRKDFLNDLNASGRFDVENY